MRVAAHLERLSLHVKRCGSQLLFGLPLEFRAFEPCTRWGLPIRRCFQRRWCALTAPFHPYPVFYKSQLGFTKILTYKSTSGGLFSVALSVGFTPFWLPSGSLAAQPLAGITPCSARTFLTRVTPSATVPLSEREFSRMSEAKVERRKAKVNIKRKGLLESLP